MTKRDKRPMKGERPPAQNPDRERAGDRDLSEDEKEVLQSDDRRRRSRRAPKVKVESKPCKPIDLDFTSAAECVRFLSACGTSDLDHVRLMLDGIINAACAGSPKNPPSEREINRALAAVTGVSAKDEIEGMLATQMCATHFAAINVLRQLKGSETIQQQDSNGNLAVKLLRTFAMQIEALQRYRGKGQQKVVVEHVNVHAGGQAIVGPVIAGRGVDRESEDGANEPREITHEPGTPCGARTRSGKPCQSPAVRGKRRCRMHGGAAGSGAPIENKNALRHGFYTAEAIARRRELTELIRQSRAILADPDGRGQ